MIGCCEIYYVPTLSPCEDTFTAKVSQNILASEYILNTTDLICLSL